MIGRLIILLLIVGCDNTTESEDACGVAGGDGTTCADCAGVSNGISYEDGCGTCDAETSNDCVEDCAGVWGGDNICGCTNETGCNYDSTATEDDGGCEYPEEFYDCDGNCLNVNDTDGDGICDNNDGDNYETVQIGDQLWMAENLKTTHFTDGSEIRYVQQESAMLNIWENLSTGAYCYYNDDQSNQETYGNLYNWYAVDDDRGVCPDGFHVPSDEEWTILTDYLGGESVAGGKMKSTGTYESGNGEWYEPNSGATNESGFTGLPAGRRSDSNGYFYSRSNLGRFWSSSEISSTISWARALGYDFSNVSRINSRKRGGYSVRCLADE